LGARETEIDDSDVFIREVVERFDKRERICAFVLPGTMEGIDRDQPRPRQQPGHSRSGLPHKKGCDCGAVTGFRCAKLCVRQSNDSQFSALEDGMIFVDAGINHADAAATCTDLRFCALNPRPVHELIGRAPFAAAGYVVPLRPEIMIEIRVFARWQRSNCVARILQRQSVRNGQAIVALSAGNGPLLQDAVSLVQEALKIFGVDIQDDDFTGHEENRRCCAAAWGRLWLLPAAEQASQGVQDGTTFRSPAARTAGARRRASLSRCARPVAPAVPAGIAVVVIIIVVIVLLIGKCL